MAAERGDRGHLSSTAWPQARCPGGQVSWGLGCFPGHHAHSLTEQKQSWTQTQVRHPGHVRSEPGGNVKGHPGLVRSPLGGSRDPVGAGRWRGWAMGSLDSQQALPCRSPWGVSQTQHTGAGSPAPPGLRPSAGQGLAFSLGDFSRKEVMGRHWSGPGTVSRPRTRQGRAVQGSS